MGIANGGYNNPFALVGANPNKRYEVVAGLFFTNGGSAQASATITFNKPFTNVDIIMPGHISNGQSISYSNTISYPWDYNITTTGFSVQLNAGGPLGTVGNPQNLVMYFLVIGD